MKKIVPYIVLHAVMAVCSVGGICSKMAASKEFLSPEWILLYGLLLFTLAFYAVMWQQILKKIPLNVAYANKAVGLIWGMMWGCIVFNETIGVPQIIGALLILAGIILMAPVGDKGSKEKKDDE
ncbi:MAG: EamA family transporter [Ruminiclostridium sp.]|nr:EamA family transporter [Ruminiclostridium sp.]